MAELVAVDYQTAIDDLRLSVFAASKEGQLFSPNYVCELLDVVQQHAEVNAIFREARSHRSAV